MATAIDSEFYSWYRGQEGKEMASGVLARKQNVAMCSPWIVVQPREEHVGLATTRCVRSCVRLARKRNEERQKMFGVEAGVPVRRAISEGYHLMIRVQASCLYAWHQPPIKRKGK